MYTCQTVLEHYAVDDSRCNFSQALFEIMYSHVIIQHEHGHMFLCKTISLRGPLERTPYRLENKALLSIKMQLIESIRKLKNTLYFGQRISQPNLLEA